MGMGSAVVTMEALVLRKGRATIEERPVPRAAANEVVVRTTLASLCSADATCLSGEFPTADGTVLGHEAVGMVHEVGDLVAGFAVGQRVAVASTTPCGQCANCQRGFGGHCHDQAWGGYTFGSRATVRWQSTLPSRTPSTTSRRFAGRSRTRQRSASPTRWPQEAPGPRRLPAAAGTRQAHRGLRRVGARERGF